MERAAPVAGADCLVRQELPSSVLILRSPPQGGRLEGWRQARLFLAILRDAVLRTAPQDEELSYAGPLAAAGMNFSATPFMQ
jgi:hypothetical protein